MVAALHARLLPHGFFAQLGHAFLRHYYATFQDSPWAVALVAEADGEVAGMLVGPTRSHAHYRWVVRRRGPRLAAAGTLALLARPRQLARFLRTRVPRYVRAVVRMLRPAPAVPTDTSPDTAAGSGPPQGGVHADGADVAHSEVAVLTHVAVAEPWQGDGVGRALVSAFVNECRAQAAREVRLVTAADGGAAGFYRRAGWEEVSARPGGDGSLVIEFRLPLQEPASP